MHLSRLIKRDKGEALPASPEQPSSYTQYPASSSSPALPSMDVSNQTPVSSASSGTSHSMKSLYHTQVWVEHPSLGYAPGQIIREEPGQNGEALIVVEACDGYVCTVSKNHCTPVHPNSLLGVPDLLELGEFSLAALLHNIRVRYTRGEYYSSIGLPILISVNPYKPLPHLYDSSTRKKYQSAEFLLSSPPSSAKREPKSSSDRSNPKSASPNKNQKEKAAPLLFIDHPHLFGTAQMTYTSLVNNNQAQSIVVSGESGAGKTEATKILLRYFSELDDSLCKSPISSKALPPFSPTRSPMSITMSPNSSQFGKPQCQQETAVELHALRSNPILEAFGNAKTLRNDNSSRFGKFIQIWFEKKNMKRIRSARISHYLLEKCRLVSLHPHERNYHVFYALVYGGQRSHSDKLKRWGIDVASPNTKLSILGNDHRESLNIQRETETFCELETCLLSTGFTPEEIDGVFGLVAAMMLLFEVEFQPLQGLAAQKAQCSGNLPICELACGLDKLEKVIQLLQLDKIPPESRGTSPLEAVLELFQYKIIVDREKAGSWIYTKRDTAAATHVRDAIIKEFYSRLFDWLVKKINKTLCFKEEVEKERTLHDQASRKMSSMFQDFPMTLGSSQASGTSSYNTSMVSSKPFNPSLTTPKGLNDLNSSPAIGLLDIYGFEVFEGRNSFEQLCINFANEKLQQHFNHHVLSLEQKIYHNEGIDWSDILFTDNQHVIDALENSTYGVFFLLNTACYLNAADSYLLQEIERHGRKDVISLPTGKKTNMFMKKSFIVKHYAGPVQYNVEGFIEKNQDRLSPECEYFFQKASSHLIVKQLFAIQAVGPTRRYNWTNTVTQTFRFQLEELLTSLTKTTPTYVRCIKPNGLKAPHKFDSIDCMRQLKYAGLLESIRIRNSGFGVRCTFEEFLSKYAILDKNILTKWHKCCRNDPSIRVEKAEWCHEILSSVLPPTVELMQRRSRGTAVKSIPKRAWQLGQTRVFMKEEVQIHLEKDRAARFNQVVTRIQSIFRGYQARQAYEEAKRCIVVIQSYIRMHFARLEYFKLKQEHELRIRAANNMKRLLKGLKCRKRFLSLKRAVNIISSWYTFHLWIQYWRQQLSQRALLEDHLTSGGESNSCEANETSQHVVSEEGVDASGDVTEPGSIETMSSLPKKKEELVRRTSTGGASKASSKQGRSKDTDRSNKGYKGDGDDSHSEEDQVEEENTKSARTHGSSRYKTSEKKKRSVRALRLSDPPPVVPQAMERRRDGHGDLYKTFVALLHKYEKLTTEAPQLRAENKKLRDTIAEKERDEARLKEERVAFQKRVEELGRQSAEMEYKYNLQVDVMSSRLNVMQDARAQYDLIFDQLSKLRAECYYNQNSACHDINEIWRVITYCCNERDTIAAREETILKNYFSPILDSDNWDGSQAMPSSSYFPTRFPLPPLSSSTGWGMSTLSKPSMMAAQPMSHCSSSSRHMYRYPQLDSLGWTDGLEYPTSSLAPPSRHCYAHGGNMMSSEHDMLNPVTSARPLGSSALRGCDQQSSAGNGSYSSRYVGNSPTDIYGRNKQRFLNTLDLSSLTSNRGASADDLCDHQSATCVCVPKAEAMQAQNHRMSMQRGCNNPIPKLPKSARQTPTHRTSASLRLQMSGDMDGNVQAVTDRQSRRTKLDVGSETGSIKGPITSSPSSRATQTAAAPYMQLGGRPLGTSIAEDTTYGPRSNNRSGNTVQRAGIHGACLDYDDDDEDDFPLPPNIPFYEFLPQDD
eukprot:Blabericola_migrator_1__6948@NODE_351_length_9502_cov_328_954743_g265_i2_p1_GENE_NODE_351_length_9502_cov_328_954743_g265_i2NODE_351_length_9502_cov_328_954743_g265_i2_p1_ORF_typecomplete_len1743_score397_06Myosin_head/PF00063_21/2e91Myosin_head/PF00063_21/3_8e81IQ/PF00612_27/0_0016IQ/PF00612_27/0_041Seryl_tRNA_N/PF02403_22/0_00025ZapB/PF06005_12/5_2e03ZapB/PF06005_12/0_00014SHE3/PF17078_5/0_003BBP1_C/PF15272_6/0_025Myosin_N/PF02736_19/0_019DUF724/PF05266_14/0_039APG6_N/PF17675_1/0_033TniB/PF056